MDDPIRKRTPDERLTQFIEETLGGVRVVNTPRPVSELVVQPMFNHVVNLPINGLIFATHERIGDVH